MFPDLSRYCVIAILLLTAIPGPLLGEEIKLVPGLAVKDEFNDNIFLTTGSRRSDFIATVTPSLEISRGAELHNLSLSGGLNWLRYARNSSLNSVDFFGQTGFGYQFDPRLSLSVGAGYVRDSRPDRIDQGGLTLKSGSDRQNYQASGNYAVSEKSSSTLSYAFSQENFDNTGSVTTSVHNVTLGQNYDIDRYLRQTKLVGNLGFSRNLTDISLVDNYTVSAGFTRKMHELWSIALNAGGRYTNSEFDVIQGKVSARFHDEDLGWIGNLAVNYSGETTNGSLTVNHDVTTASGRSGTTKRTGVSVNVNERFTRELSGIVGVGYSWNRSDQNQFSAQAIDEKNLTLSGAVRYDFSEYVALEGTYRYNRIDYSHLSSQAIQNVFMLRFTLRRDLMDL